MLGADSTFSALPGCPVTKKIGLTCQVRHILSVYIHFAYENFCTSMIRSKVWIVQKGNIWKLYNKIELGESPINFWKLFTVKLFFIVFVFYCRSWFLWRCFLHVLAHFRPGGLNILPGASQLLIKITSEYWFLIILFSNSTSQDSSHN